MAFIDGYLAACSAVGLGTCTEMTGAGYTRAAMRFSDPVDGTCVNAGAWSFGQSLTAQIAGRAIFDAPTGGNLLLVMPLSTPRALATLGPQDNGGPGDLTLVFSALEGWANGAAFSGTLAAGAAVGICYDRLDQLGTYATPPTPAAGVAVIPTRGGYLAVRPSTVSAGAALTIRRGLLSGP
ncbi:MAG: hypothetical protein RQ966_12855 [Acetobacteraceae bacterium]|nr:hypothetical protein [Acetobacteraceae bacterium]